MGNRTAVQPQSTSVYPLLLKGLLALSGGLVLFFIFVTIIVTGYSAGQSAKIFTGVSVGGIDLSGLQPVEAVKVLKERLTYPQTGRIVFEDGPKLWITTPNDLGLYLDPENSILAAYGVGRQGNLFKRFIDQLRTWYRGVDLSPILVYDQAKAYSYLDHISVEVNKPVVEASLKIKGTEVQAIAGQVGLSLDIAATISPVENLLHSMTDGMIPVIIRETLPAIMDATAQAETARMILSAPLTLKVPNAREGDPLPWVIDPQTLAGMVTIQRVDTSDGAAYEVGLSSDSLRSYLQNIATKFDNRTENTRFIFNDETRQLEVLQPAVIGRTLNIEATLQEIYKKVFQGEHTVDLTIEYNKPQITDDATADKLGITGLVSSYTSYFYGSSGERIHNIQTAAARFHGLLVPPGETFSMSDALGDVSLDTGYAEALIIYGDRTIKGVGGGVCQVSTTLFRTAFFGGYPIVERHPHAYRVTYYELIRSGSADTDLAGLDATVFAPVVDFKFVNDTPYWLLMETYVNQAARSITWKFYSTPDGRTVKWETSGLQNIVEPEDPIFQENPDLAKGEIKQVDWEVAGADVTVNRTVYKDDKVYIEDTFITHYMPWRAIYEYGPGTNLTKLMKKVGVPMPWLP